MTDALIRLEQVAVTLSGQSVLDNIQLSVKPGEIVTTRASPLSTSPIVSV
ncbi:hypothetical protein CFBP6109_00383 [Pseudomonas syringae pv. cerasicola]|nr:hypothetical protein CFBP6109_00383 [Pseudomonas syringae pv. cerasicola]SPF12673.1 hypothetical protein PSCFBP6110_00148 [Pseudomonas syringae pv. cerasicola]